MGYFHEALSRTAGHAPYPTAGMPHRPTAAQPVNGPADQVERSRLGRRSLSDQEDQPLRLELPAIPVQLDPKTIDDRLVAAIEPNSQVTEEYRSIRTSLLARWDHRRHLVHTLTSATPQEGKTLTSLNLGFAFGEMGNRRTLVIEADLRLPRFAPMLSLPESPGLIGLLKGEAQPADAIFRINDLHTHVLPAGGRATDQAIHLLSSRAMEKLLSELRHQYDHVIIDTPPIVELADAGIIGALSDDVFLIVKMGRTPRGLVEQALRVLSNYNTPVAGVIATNQTRMTKRYYYRYSASPRRNQAERAYHGRRQAA